MVVRSDGCHVLMIVRVDGCLVDGCLQFANQREVITYNTP